MDEFECKASEIAITQHVPTPKLHLRYVDDCLEIHKNNDTDLQDYLAFLNGIHKNITFTFEKEINGCLPFLDVLLTREANTGHIRTSVFRKPTHTDAYVNQRSNQSIRVKKGIIKGQLIRARRICKDPVSWQKEYEHIENVFIKNGYTRALVRRCQQELSRKERIQKIETDKETTRKRFIAMSYVPGVTEKIRKALRKHGIEVKERAGRKMKNILVRKSRGRTEAPEEVYCIPCQDCQRTYVGETMRGKEKRMKEHQRMIRNFEMERSEIAAHCHNEDHRMNWQAAETLTKERNWFKRQVKEAIWSERKKSFNRRREISTAWASMIK